jgi:dihydroxyacid dehydratase/phosphogluconate dehydratase
MARSPDPELDVTSYDFLVLQNAGPSSPAGMPEAGYLPIPAKLARAGVKSMVRISDARVSGTAYGSIVWHVIPARRAAALWPKLETTTASAAIGESRILALHHVIVEETEV